MSRNPILDELYAARAKLLADAGGDIRKLLEGVREREAASGLLWQLPKDYDQAGKIEVVDDDSGRTLAFYP